MPLLIVAPAEDQRVLHAPFLHWHSRCGHPLGHWLFARIPGIGGGRLLQSANTHSHWRIFHQLFVWNIIFFSHIILWGISDFWYTESSADILLALHRFIEILAPKLGGRLFTSKKNIQN
jgi:hypothetical protein